MKKLKTILTIFILFLVACVQKDEVYLKLERAETLLENYQDSCVKIILDEINSEKVLSDQNKAYYNLLITGYNYGANDIEKTDSLIDFSIRYYGKHLDNQKLAKSYYYRALKSFKDYSDSVLLDLKQAETVVKKTDDYVLASKIYGALAIYFGNLFEFEEALKYAKNEFFCAKMAMNDKLKAHSLINLSVSYGKIGQKDSAFLCAKASEKFAAQLKPHYRAYIFYNLGAAFFETSPSVAENYLKKSLECEKLAQSYALLSDLYVKSGRNDDAKKLWEDAINISWGDVRTQILSMKAEYEFETGDFNAFRATKDAEINSLNECQKEQLENRALELSKNYDFQLQEEKFKLLLTLIIISALFLSVIFYMLYRAKMRRVEREKLVEENKLSKLAEKNAVLKKENAEYELNLIKGKDLLKKMESDLEVLKNDKKSKTRTITLLEKRISQLKNDYQDKLKLGKECFDKLKNNISPLNWSEMDILCLLEYVSVSESEFYSRIETMYTGLNNQQKLFLVVSDLLKKDVYTLCMMFSLEKDSLWQKKSRIKSKRVKL